MDHILIVANEAALRDSLLRCLSGEPSWGLLGVGTLGDAVRALDAQAPNLILLDLEPPDSGLELLPELALRNLKLPIVVITSNSSKFQAEFRDVANIDVVPKPLVPAELKRLVSERLTRAKHEVVASAFTVADYLQLAGMARRSVVLTISEGSKRLGQILVQDGSPRWAGDGEGSGEAAFRRLALLPRAEVACSPLQIPVSESNLSGSLEQQLIEAARTADEAKRRGRPSKPSAAKRSSSPSSRPTLSPPASAPRIPPPPPLPGRPRLVEERRADASGSRGLAAFKSLANLQSKGADSHAAREKVMTLNRPTKPTLTQLLALDGSLKAAARADRQGSVLEASGEFDAETACAVAIMATRQVADASADLGLGAPSAWHLAAGNSTWYVVQCREELVLGFGGATKNPISTLRKLAKNCGVVT
jgi:CheY-like chemotaxis protein